jgi:hypothetical protein
MKRRRPTPARITARELNGTFIGSHLTVYGWTEEKGPITFSGVLSDLEPYKGGVFAYIGGRRVDLGDDVAIDVKAPE